MDILKNMKKNNKNDMSSLLKVIISFGGVFSFAIAIEHFFEIPIMTTVLVLAAVIILIYISNFINAIKDYILDFLKFEKRIKTLEKEVGKLKNKGKKK